MHDIQIECFLSLAETLNFRATARNLYISQQAVSKNIAKLESTIGFPLFYRNPHSVRLTPWGTEYLKLNKEYVQKEYSLLKDYQNSNNQFHISTLFQPEYTPITNIHPYKIPETNYYANIRVSCITPAANVHDILNNEADMVVTLDRFLSDTTGLVVYPVLELEATFLVSKKHPLYHEGVSYEVFSKEPLISGVPSEDLFETRESLKKDIDLFKLKPSSIIIMSSTDDALNAACRGDGIILGSIIGFSPYKEFLTTVPLNKTDHIVCVWNEKNNKSYIKDLAEFIKQEYKEFSES